MSDTPLFNIVIPARYGSSRLPGKPLMNINGKTMIHRVYENALAAGAANVAVATDDHRIVDEIESFGGTALMTAQSHRSGTDRIAEVAKRLKWSNDTIVVNLQGDEPGIPPDLLRQVATSLADSPSAGISTIATPIKTAQDLFDPNVVKTVLDNSGHALYFSRAPVPFVRDLFKNYRTELPPIPSEYCFLRHLGLYAYRVDALKRMSQSPPSELETAESLEQLRAMSIGLRIQVSVVDAPPGNGVDTLEDLERVQAQLSGKTTVS